MENTPDKSGVVVFRAFVSRLMSFQNQLHENYNYDRQICDMLLNVVDIGTVCDVLCDPTPRTAHQLINRVANDLPTQNTTAVSSYSHVTPSPDERLDEEVEQEVVYTVGM